MTPAPGPMEVLVNGRRQVLAPGTTLAALVAGWRPARDGAGPVAGIAVALNDEVVPRSEWGATELSGQDRVEVLTASQGG